MLWLTIIVFVGLLLLLVLVHEFGHFWAARRAGCKVEEFAFGFPPRIAAITRGGTRYSFNLLPLGGYVKIAGEDMRDKNPPPDSFASKTASWRIFILAAGVLMNVAAAVVLLAIQAGVGVPTLVTDENVNAVSDIQTFIVDVRPGSPAEHVGIEPLDRIVQIGPVVGPDVASVQNVVAEHEGRELTLEVVRQGRHEMVTTVPRADPPEGEGALGIALQETGLERSPWWKAPWVGIKRTGEMLSAIAVQFYLVLNHLISEGTAGDVLTGPVGIAVYTNEVTNLGLSYVLEFGALISLNLALINILPIPALDGGRILFVVIEKALGRRLPAQIEHYSHLTGFAFLILLMLLITFKDVGRYFS